jgi:hypothetical protein
MNEFVFYEYTAKLTCTPHAEEREESVHCLIEMNIVDQSGRRRHGAELEEEAGALILFAVNPIPKHRIGDSKIWQVNEQRLNELGPATATDRIGNCQIYFYKETGS